MERQSAKQVNTCTGTCNIYLALYWDIFQDIKMDATACLRPRTCPTHPSLTSVKRICVYINNLIQFCCWNDKVQLDLDLKCPYTRYPIGHNIWYIWMPIIVCYSTISHFKMTKSSLTLTFGPRSSLISPLDCPYMIFYRSVIHFECLSWPVTVL